MPTSTREHWEALPLLSDPALKVFAADVLRSALGPLVGASTLLPAMIWDGGAADTYGGKAFTGTVGDFVSLLEHRAQEVVQKRAGWVVTPTSNKDGHRVNASTTAMHALNLDCDGRGAWDRLIEVLSELSAAFIAYQSGGWTEATPKWHIVLPLSEAFDVSTEEKQGLWKTTYTSARVIFGALGELLGEGFDPTIETPSQPVFITERRRASDPVRKVVWRPGHSIDLVALAIAMPLPEESKHRSTHPLAEALPLDDARLEEIVTALCVPMSKILSGRRYLYLALPGTLLDRGVKPDDLRRIIEAISLRCTGDPEYTTDEILSKHEEHLHCTETTIHKWERKETYYRIGTLVESWPEVATVIDSVLPSKLVQLALEANKTAQAAVDEPIADVDLSTLRRIVAQTKRRKLESDDSDQLIHGLLLNRLLDGEALVSVGDVTGLDRDEAVRKVASVLAFRMPIATPTEAIAELLRPSVNAMLTDNEAPSALLQSAENAYLFALGNRVENEEKYDAEVNAKFERARMFFKNRRNP